MKHSATLIEKFLRNECNENEKQQVMEYIVQHPEALQPYLTEESWHSFQPGQTLPEEISGKMMNVIESRTFQKRKINKQYYAWAAAIGLLVASGAVWTIFHQSPAKQVAAVNTIKTNNTTAIRTSANNTQKIMSFQLSDGSIVELAPQSQVKYEDPFTASHRDVYLKGQAVFRVKGDKNNPFTVHAGQVTTTALGTEFKITAWEQTSITQVQLISGKVVVKWERPSAADRAQEIFLRPGQELVFDARKMSMEVNTSKKNTTPAPIKEIITFSNEPLANIFRQMSEKYQVKIAYTANTLTGINFTGTFDSNKETLKDFLTTIGTLNNLTIHQKNNVIYITQ